MISSSLFRNDQRQKARPNETIARDTISRGTCVHWSFSLSRRPFSVSNISWRRETTWSETTWPQRADVENHRFWVQDILEKDGNGYIEMFSKCSYITSSGFELPRHCDIMFDTLTISARIFHIVPALGPCIQGVVSKDCFQVIYSTLSIYPSFCPTYLLQVYNRL